MTMKSITQLLAETEQKMNSSVESRLLNPSQSDNGNTSSGGLGGLKMTPLSDSIHQRLCAPFDRSEEKTRKQNVAKKGDTPRYIELTYIDARAVMYRLDEVVGSANWQSRMVLSGDKVACELSVKFGDEWITKTDGAGETDIEGDKGSFSDAFKRAAVHFGVGRYLYGPPPKKRVVASVLDGVDGPIDQSIDEAEMQIRSLMNKLRDGVLNTDIAQDDKQAILFGMDGDEKVRLWGRFNSRERSLMKKLEMDW